MPWLTLALLLCTVPALAQVDDPGEPSDEPYVACEGCQGWSDPYAYELARLRLERPSYFWPHALILAGAGTMVAGVSMAEGGRTATIVGPAVAGIVALTLGLIWRSHRSREREPYDQRIAELEAAHSELPLHQQAIGPVVESDEVRALRRQRPRLGKPIALTSVGAAGVGAGALALFVGVALHDSDAAIAGAVLTAGGLAVVAGGVTWWVRTRRRQRPYNERIRELSSAPLLIRF